MSAAQNSLQSAILFFMAEHNIKRGSDCPVLRVTLAGYNTKGEPLFSLRPATGDELCKAATGNMKAEGN